jgi:protein required for attachment to host cells
MHGGQHENSHSAFGGETFRRHRIEEFAGAVCVRMAEEWRRHGAQRLHVIAEPVFLGLLRQRIDPALARATASEHAKSLTGQSAEAIRAELPRQL